ncbi:MAG: ABC transporter substrate-binding protein [Acetatifactor sp.]|nr:ABC transporter substrate-binding protein [Acetatifactor sp.]
MSRKKVFIAVLLSVFMIVTMVGCANHGTPSNESEENKGDVIFKDNTLDKYTAFINEKIEIEMPEGALDGGGAYLRAGNGRGYRFKKHLFSTFEECWDELSIVTNAGTKKSLRFELDAQVWSIGEKVGSDHYLCAIYRNEDGENSLHVLEIDENQTIYQDINLTYLDGRGYYTLDDLTMDAKGNLHFIASEMSVGENDSERINDTYTIVSPQGEVLYSEEESAEYDILGIVYLPGGMIAYRVGDYRDNQSSLCELISVDSESRKKISIIRIPYTSDEMIRFITLDSASMLVYATPTGVYSLDKEADRPEVLYLFQNHGITAKNIWSLYTDARGNISVIYENMDEQMFYLGLEKTVEQREIQTIQFAVDIQNVARYRNAVALFNKKYPNYHIELVTDMEKSRLLTELVAGGGPVLIDSSLVGFEDYIKLWMPLDSTLKEDISDALLDQVTELGRVDGQLYGIITDFSIETLVVKDTDIETWSYDEFATYLEQHQDYVSPCDNIEINSSWGFIYNFFCQGIDKAYFTSNEGSVSFDVDRFERAFKLALWQSDNHEIELPGESLLKDEVVCNRIRISRPEQLELYRLMYGETVNFIGYPTEEGAVHYIDSNAPLCIRDTANAKEKEIACEFLNVLLSYDGQAEAINNTTMAFSVREDVIRKQFEQVGEETIVFALGFEETTLGKRVDMEKARNLFDRLIFHSEGRKRMPTEVSSIFIEELELLEGGVIDQNSMISHIDNRITLYLDER